MIKDAPFLSGCLGEFPLPDILLFLSQMGWDMRVELLDTVTMRRAGSIWIRGKDLVDARSLGRRGIDGFFEILLRAKGYSHRFTVFHEPMFLRPRMPIGNLEFFILEFHRQADEEILRVPPPPPNPPELGPEPGKAPERVAG